MNVLVLSHMYPAKSQPTNGVFVHEQAKALTRRGINLRVMSPVTYVPRWVARLAPRWARRAAIPCEASWEGVAVEYPRYLAFPGNRFFASSGQRLYRALRAPVACLQQMLPLDLIHAHVVLPSGAASVRLSKDLGIPFAVTVHGLDLLRSIDRGQSYERAIGHTLRRASAIILVSRRLEAIAHERFPEIRGKTVVIGNGVDPNELPEVPRETETSLDEPVILSVSNLILTKGIDLNLRAVARIAGEFPRVRYRIVGDGPEEDRLRELAKSLGIEDRVTFSGRVSHPEVLRAMASCAIFSLPSWREAQGVVYLEAMALARPVIGCSTEGISEIVRHGETGWLAPPQDVDALAEGLSILLRDADARQRIGQRARSLVLRDHTWGASAAKVHNLYERVLGAVDDS